ncbi:MAG: hypothetical protein WBG50_04795 [Desulfomonilaceae bacterium]
MSEGPDKVQENLPEKVASPESKEKNKVAWCALVVSIISAVISGISVFYTSQQSKIANQNNLPDIEITQSMEEGLFRRTSVISIINTGGPLKNFECETLPFLVVMLNKDEVRYIRVPLKYYLYGHERTGRIKGVISRIKSDGYHKFITLRDDFVEAHQGQQGYPAKAMLSTRTYIKLTYVDSLDKVHVSYFEIEDGKDRRPITKDRWNFILEEYESTSVSIYDLTPEKLTQRVFDTKLTESGRVLPRLRHLPQQRDWSQKELLP